MDARRDYIMKGLKKRCKKKYRMNKKNSQEKKKQQDKIHGKTKFDSANNMKRKTSSFGEPSGSNDKVKSDVEYLHDNTPKEQDFNSFTELSDFHNDNHKNPGSSYFKNKEEKPLESELDDQESVNKDDDSLDLDHACADMLQNNIEQIKTELNNSKEKSLNSRKLHNSRKSHCIKPQRVTFGSKFKRNRKKCAKRKKSKDDIETEAIASISGFQENRLSKGDTSDKSEEETEDIVLYKNKNAESKHKSRRNQLLIKESDNKNGESKYKSQRKQSEENVSDVSEEEDSSNAESKHKFRRRKSEINESDGSVEESNRNAESKYKSRRKQPEINQSGESIEEDSRNVESKHKSRRKQLESDDNEEDGKNTELKHKSRRKQPTMNESDICAEEDERIAESKHKSRRKHPEINESEDNVGNGKNVELKHKSQRKQPEINKSDITVEEDSRNAESKYKSRRKQSEIKESEEEDGRNAESKYKSRTKQPEIKGSDTSVKEDAKNAESKYKSRRKQPEIKKSDTSVEKDTRNVESNYKSHRKQPETNESNMNVEDSINAEPKYKSQKALPKIDASVIGIDNKPKQKQNDYYNFVNKKKFGKYGRMKRKISPECARYLREHRRKQSRSSSLSKSNHSLSKPSSSIKFEYPKKSGDVKNLFDSKFSLDCKAILAAKKKERKPKSASDLSCTCDEILRNRRKRDRSRNSESEKLLKKRKKKKISQLSKKHLKTSKKKTSSACEKLLKNQGRSRSASSSSGRKLLDTQKKKKHRSPESEKLLKSDRKKKSVTICTCDSPKERRSSLPRRRRRKSYHAPVLEDCGKELKKLNRALSNKIQQKESLLLGSWKKGKRKKKVKSKPEEPQVPNCRCASSDLKDRYTKMMEDYQRLKRQYEALKCTNALIEKKLRCFMKKSKCKCTR